MTNILNQTNFKIVTLEAKNPQRKKNKKIYKMTTSASFQNQHS